MGLRNFLKRNADVLQQIYGSIDDIGVKSKLGDVQQELAKYEGNYRKWMELQGLHTKLSGYQLTEDDIGKMMKPGYTAGSDFEEQDAVKNSEIFSQYLKTPKQVHGMDVPGTGNYLDYIKTSSPDELTRLKGLGLVQENQREPNKDEVADYIAGKILSPDEQNLYGQLKGFEVNPLIHNFGLKKLMIDARKNLTSTGELGGSLADDVIQQAGLYGIPEKQGPKVHTQPWGDYLIKFDEAGNLLGKTRIKDEKIVNKNTVAKYNKMTFDEAEQLLDNELSGDAFFYLPKDVQDQLMVKYPALQQMHDAKFKEGDFMPKLGGSRFKGGKVNFSLKDTDEKGKLKNIMVIKDKLDSGIETTDAENDLYNSDIAYFNKKYELSPQEIQQNAEELYTAETTKGQDDVLTGMRKGEFAESSDESASKYFSDYMQSLNEAYTAEQSGQQAKGYYDNFRKAFLSDLEKYKRYLTKQDYEYLYNSYK